MVQWSKELHRSASCAAIDPGLIPGSVAVGRDRETHGARTIGPVSSELGEGLPGMDILVPSCSSDSCGRPERNPR